MHRPGCDPDNMTEADFLCDFCEKCYAPERPMVEGHRGSLICGQCLTTSFAALWYANTGEAAPKHDVCMMCLSENGDPVWRSPVRETSLICKRCAKQSAVMLERDEECGWKRPPEA